MTEHWNLILYVFISVCIMYNLHTHTCISIDSRILREQEAVASVTICGTSIYTWLCSKWSCKWRQY